MKSTTGEVDEDDDDNEIDEVEKEDEHNDVDEVD